MMASVEMNGSPVMNSIHGESADCEKDHNRTFSQQGISSLVVMSMDATGDPLLNYCTRNRTVHWFLRITANYWPIDSGCLNTDKLYYMLTRCVNIGSCVANFALMWVALFSVDYPNDTLRYISAGIDFAIVVRTLSVMPVQYVNQRRLLEGAHQQDILALEESVKIASIFGAVSTCSNLLGTILLANSSVPVNAAVFVTEYFLTSYLTFNMFFLILDIKVSSLLIDQLHLLADSKQLTMDKYMQVKEEIHRRVRKSRWASDLIILPCIASVVAIAVLIFLLSGVEDRALQIETAAFIMLMLKELFFVAVAFWYIAKVNGKADELTVKLSRSVWGVYGACNSSTNHKNTDYDVESSTNSTGVSMNVIENGTTLRNRTNCTSTSALETAQVPDIYRLSIHASCLSEPISFTLLFKRLTWVNVAVSAGGFGLTIVIAVIKNILGLSGGGSA